MSNKLFYLICLALVLAIGGFAQAEMMANPGFEADLTGDYVDAASFETDDGFGGSYIFLREGPVVVAVTAMAAGTTEMEAVSEAVVAFVLGRLHGDD